MKVCECKTLTKCDFSGCSNWAKYSFATKGIFKHDLCFCQDCLKQMYEALAKMQTPKPIESPFKYGKKLKKISEEKL